MHDTPRIAAAVMYPHVRSWLYRGNSWHLKSDPQYAPLEHSELTVHSLVESMNFKMVFAPTMLPRTITSTTNAPQKKSAMDVEHNFHYLNLSLLLSNNNAAISVMIFAAAFPSLILVTSAVVIFFVCASR